MVGLLGGEEIDPEQEELEDYIKPLKQLMIKQEQLPIS